MTKRKKSRILEEVHETAKGLHRIGLIDKRKMEKYDLLCLEPVPDYSPKAIKALRSKYHISQTVLAAILNTSSSAVRQWEIGEKRPGGPSLKLLNILDNKGIEVFINGPGNSAGGV
jgi:putative transcriptional regulator